MTTMHHTRKTPLASRFVVLFLEVPPAAYVAVSGHAPMWARLWLALWLSLWLVGTVALAANAQGSS